MLNERAMKVTLKRTRPALTRRDETAEKFVTEELGDTALVVNKRLFRDRSNPVNQILQALDQVYAYHKANTLPYVDAGPRLLSNAHYFEYQKGMRERMDVVTSLLDKHMPNYDQYVQLDITHRTKQAALAKAVNYHAPSADEYPTAEEFRSSLTISLRYETLPDAPHAVLDEDKEEIRKLHEQIASQAKAEVVKEMLEPLKHLADKLTIPIGEKGAIFRDSAIENIRMGIDKARKLTIIPDANVDAITAELDQALASASANVEWLRESPINRKATAEKFADIASKMGALMGGA